MKIKWKYMGIWIERKTQIFDVINQWIIINVSRVEREHTYDTYGKVIRNYKVKDKHYSLFILWDKITLIASSSSSLKTRRPGSGFLRSFNAIAIIFCLNSMNEEQFLINFYTKNTCNHCNIFYYESTA